MITNYFKIALRNIWRNKTYSFLNIAGLAIGIACCVLILLFVYGELSYDRHHEQADQIYRVAEIYKDEGKIVEESASIPFPVGPTLEQAFPGIKQVRFYKTFEKVPMLANGDKRFYEDKLLFTDSTVFDIFTFPMIQGNPEKALTQPFSIVLTETMAKKYFGDENPLGKTLRFENKLDFAVTGVIKDLPPTSHMHFDFLASMLNLGELFKASGTTFGWTGWYWNPCHTFVLLPPGMSESQFESQLPNFVQTHTPQGVRANLEFYLQPLTDIHLKSHIYQEAGVNGSEQTVYLFTIIAIFVLVIACINFMNLATARSIKRAKEIAVRKVVGAFRPQLIRQFMGESLVISLLSGVLAFGLVSLFLPVFNQIAGTKLNVELIGYPPMLISIFILSIIVGLLAGTYPALFLSSYKPVAGLNAKSGAPTNWSAIFLRKGLVVFQFAISITLLIGTLVIDQQHNFLENKELGFNKEQLLMIPIRGTTIKNREESFKDRLRKESGVVNTCAISNILGRDVQVVTFGAEGKDQGYEMPGLFVDHDFIETFDVVIKQGRGFDRSFATDSSAFILNESASATIGWEEPIGKRMTFDKEGQVIGVVKDFNFSKLQERIRPMTIKIDVGWFSYIAVRLAPGNMAQTMSRLETAWQEFEPERPFEPFFLDENLNQLYEKEARLSSIFSAFSLLAIFIGCLGLFGLASFAVEQRTKEIGIRRVLGASVSGIIQLFSKDFLQLIALAILIASPIAWYGMNQWLEDFPYRIEISWWIYVIAGAVVVLIAFLTVSFQATRAAMANPVDSLKTE
ncbi:MAG: ABC transporter permease [Saprospiraceae bacterium]|nr:ABC transporter permease [Saprospiraceae bacterium]